MDLSEMHLPRYARVNTLKASFTRIQKDLRAAGFDFIKPERRRAGGRRTKNEVSTKKSYKKDPHVPNLLVFRARGSGLSKLDVVQEGELVIQQKASCFPVMALAPPLGSFVIDACAAPGSKTTQLAAFLQNTGTVFAFDQDPRRLEILQNKIHERGATNVRATLHNFLDVKPTELIYRQVTHILLDPSCSSSGLHTHGPELAPLVENQLKCINHAMRFPRVKKIVYSTCSIHDEENEAVVCKILDTHPEYELEHALPFWPRRGKPLDGRGELEKCVRTLLEDDTIGFFLATFRKRTVNNSDPTVPASCAALSTLVPSSFSSTSTTQILPAVNISDASTKQCEPPGNKPPTKKRKSSSSTRTKNILLKQKTATS